MYSKISTVIAIYNDNFFFGGGGCGEGVINGPWMENNCKEFLKAKSFVSVLLNMIVISIQF